MLCPRTLNHPLEQPEDAPSFDVKSSGRSFLPSRNVNINKKDHLSKKLHFGKHAGTKSFKSLQKNEKDCSSVEPELVTPPFDFDSHPLLSQSPTSASNSSTTEPKEIPTIDDHLFDGDSIDKFFTSDDEDDELLASVFEENLPEKCSPQHQETTCGEAEESHRPTDMATTLLKCLDILEPPEHPSVSALEPIEMNTNDFFENDANTMALVMESNESSMEQSSLDVPAAYNTHPTTPQHYRVSPPVSPSSKTHSVHSQKQSGMQLCDSQPSMHLPYGAKNMASPLPPFRKLAPLPLCASSDPTHNQRLANFSKVMARGQQTTRKLQRWDKKMGLKRSHSSTMTKTTRSRKKLRDLLSRAMPEVKKARNPSVRAVPDKKSKNPASGRPGGKKKRNASEGEQTKKQRRS